MADKLTEEMKLRLPEGLYLDLARLANQADRSLSDYVRHALQLHVYGAVSRVQESAENE